MPDDLRDQYAEALTEWALMYPISSWALAEGDAAQRLAGHWGRVAAKSVMLVRDSEVETLRSRAETAEAAIARIRDLADRWGITDPGAKAEILAALDSPAQAELPGGNR